MNAEQKPVVLVTGSSGLIGAALCKALARDYQVIGFDRDGYPYPPPEAECICVDMGSGTSVKHAFERVRYVYGDRIASVIHLAAYYSFSGEPSPLYEKNHRARNRADAARAAKISRRAVRIFQHRAGACAG